MSLLPPKDVNLGPRVTDVRILLVYRMGVSRGVHGQTIGADGSGDFAVGFTGKDYAEADAKFGRFCEALETNKRSRGQSYEILSVVTDSWGREYPIAVDPPVCLSEILPRT